MVGGDIGTQRLLVSQTLSEVGHSARPALFHPLDRAADRSGVKQGHRGQHSQHIPMSRVHLHDPADPPAQRFARVGVSRGLQHATEPAALQQIRPDRLEQSGA